jgi:hypothetical protein
MCMIFLSVVMVEAVIERAATSTATTGAAGE